MRQGDFAIAGRTYPAQDPLHEEMSHIRVGAPSRRLVVVSNRVSPTAVRQARFGRPRGRDPRRSATKRRHLVRLERRGPGGGGGRAGDGHRWAAHLRHPGSEATGFRRILHRLCQSCALAVISFPQLAGSILPAQSCRLYARQSDVCARPCSDAVAGGPRLGPRLPSDPARRAIAPARRGAADRLLPAHAVPGR